ncbi:MAG TPA: alpha-1,4-glucan--maltose-1-phosphate maltosyltransferase [Lacisediminihabitans sp.]|nr:alpha-1,4-glucan--maltose-1-phosphate maltosyltransferase [Lacisediminihabitans sp.]HXD60532.1 alpha-1,4-glucan--maltose-1-phosphate maltosyltransferase [Lacisediminihabitans sp.]
MPLRQLSPQQPENLWAAKAFVGEVVPFQATVFKEGHDAIGVDLLLTDPAGMQSVHRMSELGEGTDRWQVEVLLDSPGDWSWSVQAWQDEWATWLHVAEIKVPAGIDTQVTLATGAQLLAGASAAAPDNKVLKDAAKGMASKSLAPAARLKMAADPRVTEAIERQPLASLLTLGFPLTLRVERTRAGVGSWYEFFPRSEGAKRTKNGTWTSGTFRTAARRLPAVAGMGFDVVYLPPIHPIGTSFRKGPNNSTEAGPGDPGSPWAIGSAEGGHDAIHPELGTVEDFVAFLGTAKKSGIEIAIDLALQCSPDHPWVSEHPEWFSHLPDGSIAYAENPPKKYQDIYPLNFDNDPVGLREEILRIVKYWIGLGVMIFRVDNPHTKPLRFWEWLLHEVNAEFPEVVFLAEAFTRPPMMHALAQLGFQQSYTYFTWRNTKEELADYLTELSHESSDFLRPNLFVNTPDILSEYLQFGGPAAYKVRAAIAATASPSWGVYAGYELFEDVARQGSEENVDNEKYEFKARDFAGAEAAGRSLAPYLTTLNRIRAEHPALRQLRNLELHWSDDDSILVYSKFLDGKHTRSGRSDAILVVANVDPHSVRETTVHLDPSRFGIEPGEPFEVTDLVTRQKFTWNIDNYVRLDAFAEPVHILRVEFPKGK